MAKIRLNDSHACTNRCFENVLAFLTEDIKKLEDIEFSLQTRKEELIIMIGIIKGEEDIARAGAD
jgi:hypothetical protein